MENKDNLKIASDEKLKEKREFEGKKTLKKAIEKNNEVKLKNPKAVIYVGPSVPNSILISGKVYKKLPNHIKDFISKNSVIGKLIIDVERLVEFKVKVEIKGTKENMLYSQALKVITEGGLL